MKKTKRHLIRSAIVLFCLTSLIGSNSFHWWSEKQTAAQGIGSNYKVAGSLIYIKLPVSVSQEEYLQFLNNELPKEKNREIQAKLDNVATPIINEVRSPEYLQVIFTKDNFELFDLGQAIQQGTLATKEYTNQNAFFNFIYTDCNPKVDSCIPWTDEQIQFLRQAETTFAPLMSEFFGPPFVTTSNLPINVRVRHYPQQYTAAATFAYLIKLRDPTNYKPADPPRLQPLDAMPSAPSFWHEISHIYYLNFRAYVTWSDPIAQVLAHLGKLSTPESEFDHLPIDVTYYERFNKPYLDSTAMTSTVYNPERYYARYTTAPMVWLKMLREHPSILKDFNAALFAKGYTNPTPSTFRLEREGLEILNNVINSYDNPTVEGKPFLEWFAEQYPIYKTQGRKFGVRFGDEDRAVKVYANYAISDYNQTIYIEKDDPLSDFAQSGVMNFVLYNYKDDEIYVSEPISFLGRTTVDISHVFPGGIPPGKYCLDASLIDETIQEQYSLKTCDLLFDSSLPPESIGIAGIIEGGNEYNTGTLTISPAQNQSISPVTVNVTKGYFMAPGDNNNFYRFGGRFRLDFTSQNNKKITKYITKDVYSSYITTLSDMENPPGIGESLSSSPVINNQSVISLQAADNQAVVSYLIYENGKSPFLFGKTWGISGNHTITILDNHSEWSSYLNLSASRYSLLWSKKDKSAESNLFDFGQTPVIYISKWIQASPTYLIFKIRVRNLSKLPQTFSVTDPLSNMIAAGLSFPSDISNGGIFDESTQTIHWEQLPFLPKEEKIIQFSQRVN